MNQAGLSLDQAPAIDVPLRFFLTAPLFPILAAVLLAWYGPELLISRWEQPLLAATHLLTLGFLGLCMLGALLQTLPVIAGAPVPNPKRVAAITHSLVTSGTLLLAAGFTFKHMLLFKAAMLFLGPGLAYFTLIVITNLGKALPGNVTVVAMRLAIVSLGMTVVLGLVLASSHAWDWLLAARISFTNIHLAWGLLGWVGMLVTGVAFQVVPMFQLTPHYPKSILQWFVIILFCLLTLWSASFLAKGETAGTMQTVISVLLAGMGSAFGITTLWLQAKRRRKLPDITLNFWQFGMVSLLAAATLWLAGKFQPVLGTADPSLLLGVLLITGFAMSVVNGMLYKIVPFLIWFHLQSLRLGVGSVPNMREILPEQCTRPQMWLHFISVALLLAAAAGVPFIAYVAALSFGVSNLWLWLNLLSAYRLFQRLAQGKKKPADTSMSAG